MNRSGMLTAVAMLVTMCLSPVMAGAPDPNVAVIERFHAALLDTLKHGKALGVAGRFMKLETEIDADFDLALMVQFTVGPKWSGMSEGDHAALVAAFRRMTIASYAHNFREFKDQVFTLQPNADVRGPDRLVTSQIIPRGEKPVHLVYRMREKAGAAKIIDVIYESVSQIATRRADFASTVNSGGAQALVQKLDVISDKLMVED